MRRLLPLFLLFLVAACGYKGALYLPKKEAPANNHNQSVQTDVKTASETTSL